MYYFAPSSGYTKAAFAKSRAAPQPRYAVGLTPDAALCNLPARPAISSASE